MPRTRARSRLSPATRRTRAAAAPKPKKRRPVRARFSAEWLSLEALYARAAKEWAELARRAIEPNVFLDPGFAMAAARHLEAGDIGAVAVWSGRRLAGLLPGRLEGVRSGRPFPTFAVWTHAFAPLSTPLVDRSAPAEVVRTMLKALRQVPGAPKLALLPLVAESGPVAQLIHGELARKQRSATRLAPYARAALFPASEGGKAELSAKRLAELRRQQRRLAEAGAVGRVTAKSLREIEPALGAYLELEAAGWKGRAGSAAKADAESAAFFREAVLALAAERKAQIDLLRLNGCAIAASITLFSGDRAWGWKTAYDESFARFSPGMQLAFDLSQKLGADAQLALVDSCAAPGGGIVDHMWPGRMAMADWLVPLEDGFSFQVALAAERARRAAISAAKALRGLVKNKPLDKRAAGG
ncbi:MAG: GNAT family N-acetyltransferase [Bradyrhizobiaceae bacterium]|nr:GNAT family N-acetyltransferase [Bradyrhizobiaceae bacterium]